MVKMIPAAPIAAKGPLGIVQLPRLWSKLILNKKGLLQDGYFACGPGFDRVVLEGLGLEREEVIRYVEDHMPTYFDFERWILEKKGGHIAQETIDQINGRILQHEYPDPKKLTDKRREVGLPDDDPTVKGHKMNEYDDWNQFYKVMTEA